MKTRGAALLMGLVLLAALSLLAVTAGNGMVLQRRLSGNFEDQVRALQDAEQALAIARAWLQSRADVERQPGCTTDCLLPVAILPAGRLPGDPEFQGAAWWRANAQAANEHPESGESFAATTTGAEPPHWLIEEGQYVALPDDSDAATPAAAGYYRILARGSGRHPAAVAVIEAWYARPWEGDIEPGGFPPTEPAASFCRQFSDDLPCGTQAWRRLR